MNVDKTNVTCGQVQRAARCESDTGAASWTTTSSFGFDSRRQDVCGMQCDCNAHLSCRVDPPTPVEVALPTPSWPTSSAPQLTNTTQMSTPCSGEKGEERERGRVSVRTPGRPSNQDNSAYVRKGLNSLANPALSKIAQQSRCNLSHNAHNLAAIRIRCALGLRGP